ncbi:Uncharacterised protein [Kluyvera cryocrescens]|uniref:Bacterial Ig-like domain-containing protein n=1 Tax=Kluyvera cryocrescens TaxID=580 RepID=A0A485CYL9_KLUCR|nr:Uncharacterised protein [Kluyvera cryocrescens]
MLSLRSAVWWKAMRRSLSNQGFGTATPVKVATVTADAEGRWQYTPTDSLDDGKYTFYVTATDAAGNTSDPSGNLVFTVDTEAPISFSLLIVNDNIGTILGEILDGKTDDNRPTFTSVALSNQAGSIINIYDGETLIGSATIDNLGIWSFTPDAPLC